MRKIITFMITIALLILTGCETTAVPERSVTERKEISIPVITEYEPLTTFEYTEDMLYDMNKDNKEFSIMHDEKGKTYINGHINTSPVKDEEYVIEQLSMIRSILGLKDPRKQIFFSPTQSDNEVYRFNQYHGGLRLYAGDVVVNVDAGTGMIEYVSASVADADVLKTVQLDDILSEKDITAKDPSLRIKEKIIWNVNEYSKAPVVAYVTVSEDDYVIMSAVDGEIIAKWSLMVT